MNVAYQTRSSIAPSDRLVNLINARQDSRNSSKNSIVRRTAVKCEHCVSTKDRFAENRGEWNCKAFLLQLSLNSMNRVAKQSSSSLKETSVLVFATLMKSDPLPGKVARTSLLWALLKIAYCIENNIVFVL